MGDHKGLTGKVNRYPLCIVDVLYVLPVFTGHVSGLLWGSAFDMLLVLLKSGICFLNR